MFWSKKKVVKKEKKTFEQFKEEVSKDFGKGYSLNFFDTNHTYTCYVRKFMIKKYKGFNFETTGKCDLSFWKEYQYYKINSILSGDKEDVFNKVKGYIEYDLKEAFKKFNAKKDKLIIFKKLMNKYKVAINKNDWTLEELKYLLK